MSREFCG